MLTVSLNLTTLQIIWVALFVTSGFVTIISLTTLTVEGFLSPMLVLYGRSLRDRFMERRGLIVATFSGLAGLISTLFIIGRIPENATITIVNTMGIPFIIPGQWIEKMATEMLAGPFVQIIIIWAAIGLFAGALNFELENREKEINLAYLC